MSLGLRRIAVATFAAALAGLAIWGLKEAGLGAVLLIVAMSAIYPALLLALRALDISEVRELLRSRSAPEAA